MGAFGFGDRRLQAAHHVCGHVVANHLLGRLHVDLGTTFVMTAVEQVDATVDGPGGWGGPVGGAGLANHPD